MNGPPLRLISGHPSVRSGRERGLASPHCKKGPSWSAHGGALDY